MQALVTASYCSSPRIRCNQLHRQPLYAFMCVGARVHLATTRLLALEAFGTQVLKLCIVLPRHVRAGHECHLTLTHL